MQSDYINIILEMVRLLTTPNIPQYAREKTFKELVCRSVDIQPNFGTQIKEELKLLINTATSEQALLDNVLAYMSTHNCND